MGREGEVRVLMNTLNSSFTYIRIISENCTFTETNIKGVEKNKPIHFEKQT